MFAAVAALIITLWFPFFFQIPSKVWFSTYTGRRSAIRLLKESDKGVSVEIRMMRWLAASICLVTLIQPSLAQEPRAQRGLNFVETHCAMCHAIFQRGESPLKLAPPFRDLHKRYPVADLEESFSEGIRVGHPSMPEFRLDPGQIGDLIAYLQTLDR